MTSTSTSYTSCTTGLLLPLLLATSLLSVESVSPSDDAWTPPENPAARSRLSEWVDPDTPEDKFYSQNIRDLKTYKIVFSDEFNQDGRRFEDGKDPRWTAIDRPDTVNAALQFYKPEMVTTNNGFMNISTISEAVTFDAWNPMTWREERYTKFYKSGMVQGWNKFCFTGGIVELSVQLPGTGTAPGLWPAAWLMGNLGRATWTDSTNGVWPWSFDTCPRSKDEVILGTKEGADWGQKLSACGQPGPGMKEGQGRGAPEVDIFEAMAGFGWSAFTSSLQIAPRLPTELRPKAFEWPTADQWYKGVTYAGGATMNTAYYGGAAADAISGEVFTSPSYYNSQHVFRLEWEVGRGGYLRWYVDDRFLLEIPAETLTERYDFNPGKIVPNEPMYLILNTAMSNTWSALCGDPQGAASGTRCYPGSKEWCCILPAFYLVDYVRVYQDPTNPKHTVGCSPPNFPTADYIEANAALFAPLNAPTPPLLTREQVRARNISQAIVVGMAVIFLTVTLAVTLYKQACLCACFACCRRRDYSPLGEM